MGQARVRSGERAFELERERVPLHDAHHANPRGPSGGLLRVAVPKLSCLRDYGSLLSGEDVANVPWVDEFRRILKDEQAASEAAQGTKGCDAESLAYFRGLVQKYFPRQI